jgi:hypothetical protein
LLTEPAAASQRQQRQRHELWKAHPNCAFKLVLTRRQVKSKVSFSVPVASGHVVPP